MYYDNRKLYFRKIKGDLELSYKLAENKTDGEDFLTILIKAG